MEFGGRGTVIKSGRRWLRGMGKGRSADVCDGMRCAATAGMPRHGLVVRVGLLVLFGFYDGHRVDGAGLQIRGKGASLGAGSGVTQLTSVRLGWSVLH